MRKGFSLLLAAVMSFSVIAADYGIVCAEDASSDYAVSDETEFIAEDRMETPDDAFITESPATDDTETMEESPTADDTEIIEENPAADEEEDAAGEPIAEDAEDSVENGQAAVNFDDAAGLIEGIQVMADEPQIAEAHSAYPELSDQKTRVEVALSGESVYEFTSQEDGYYQMELSDLTADPNYYINLRIQDESGGIFYQTIYTANWKCTIRLSANTEYMLFFSGGVGNGETAKPANFQFKIVKVAEIENIEIKNIPEDPWSNREVYAKLTAAEYIVHYSDGQSLPIENWVPSGYYHSSFMTGIYLVGGTSRGDVFFLLLVGDHVSQNMQHIADNPVPLAPSRITPVDSYQLVICEEMDLNKKVKFVSDPEKIRVEANVDPDDSRELTLGGTFKQEKDQTVIYRYTPLVSGGYSISETRGTRVALYDEDFRKIETNERHNYNTENPLPVSGWLEAGKVYYYEITSPQDAAATIKFSQYRTVSDANVVLVSPPNKREYVIGSDEQLDIEGLQLQLSYTDGTTEVVDGDQGEDSQGNLIDFFLCESDSEGRPVYNKSEVVWNIETPGIYWLAMSMYPEYNRSFSKALVRVTLVNPGEHIHLWGEWKNGAAATTKADATQVRTCELCGETDKRDVEGTKLTSAQAVLKLTAKNLKMKTGQSTNKFRVTEMSAGDSLVSVKSSNPKLVKVSGVKPDGTFKLKAFKKTGKVKITVTLESGKKKTFKVRVQDSKVTTAKIIGVPKKLTLQYHKPQKLEALVMPVTSQDKLSFTSSNSKIVRVTSKGVLKPRRVGTAKITIRSGKKKVTCRVTVKK